jgi:hypothetical protein
MAQKTIPISAFQPADEQLDVTRQVEQQVEGASYQVMNRQTQNNRFNSTQSGQRD